MQVRRSLLVVAVCCSALLFSVGRAADELVVPSNAQCACVGHLLTFTCTVVGPGNTIWTGSAFNCPSTSNEIILRHSQFTYRGTSGVCNNGSIVSRSIGVRNTNSFMSELNVTVSASLNNKTVQCYHNTISGTVLTGETVLTVVSAYPPPTDVTVIKFSQGQVTFNWSAVPASCDSVDYIIASSDCGICPSSTTATSVACTGLQLPTETDGVVCSFSVRSRVCGVTGDPSIPVMYKVPQHHIPPPEVLALCSVVVWYRPEVSCESIRGYDLMLYSSQSTQKNVTRHIAPNMTFYLIQDEDKLLYNEDIFFQVRVVLSTGVGEWSEGNSLGCTTPPPQQPSVHFEFLGTVFPNNSDFLLLDVGEGEHALVCKTNRRDCCGTPPTRSGEIYYPNGRQVPIRKQQQGFYRNRGEQIIRLNRRDGVSSPKGRYRCEVPDASGVIQKVYITLV